MPSDTCTPHEVVLRGCGPLWFGEDITTHILMGVHFGARGRAERKMGLFHEGNACGAGWPSAPEKGQSLERTGVSLDQSHKVTQVDTLA